jgi:predicted transcriptional regulator YheO
LSSGNCDRCRKVLGEHNYGFIRTDSGKVIAHLCLNCHVSWHKFVLKNVKGICSTPLKSENGLHYVFPDMTEEEAIIIINKFLRKREHFVFR